MDFEQAVEDWKAHDQWEFADKKADWRFFFMAGRESKQRENEMDPYIDGVVPTPLTPEEKVFSLLGMLIGNLRRIHAAYDDEGEDLSAGIAAELQGHQRQQNGFTGARRADDQGMTDVADMQGKPERGRAFGLAE